MIALNVRHLDHGAMTPPARRTRPPYPDVTEIVVVVRHDGWATKPHHRVTAKAAYFDAAIAEREVERLNNLPERPDGTEYFVAWTKLYGKNSYGATPPDSPHEGAVDEAGPR